MFSCKTQRPTGFEMQNEVWNVTDDTTQKEIYLTSTLPIDSADPKKLIYDIFRIEIDKYPDTISVYARVYDSTGNFITNMADPYKKDPNANYFKTVDEVLGKVYNKREVNIPEFNVREFGANDSIPYNIVLSVDYSGSMGAVMDAIYFGTELFVDLKLPYDNIGITSFNKDFDVKVPLNNDKKEIINLYRVKRQQGYGLFTAVYDAVRNCMNMFEGTSRDVPRVVVIFSDGDDNYSKSELGDLIEQAKKENIHIFTVAFGYSKDENLKYLAQYTGGKFYKARSKEELISIFRDIYMSLRYHYLITYHPPKYWGWHTVYSYVDVPGRSDSLMAEGEYDTSDLWKDAGDQFKLPILFAFDSDSLRDGSFEIIDQIVDQMMSRPRLRFEIQGHTDNVGTIEYNQKLSEDRAKAVYNAIIDRGIDPRRLRWRGFGMSMPVAPNDSEENRALNRRTMFKILAK
jgi:outer membrane protein OmpA-like peptidoglycan-associated protein